ncbi:MAG: 1-acyl-sn-glycerol-3-phosphate acyltransferase [Deltaproteobacteria bacterium]|nr:1-acyl-sn-glycerol-3-phosphate acyltransferase [Deltaproteobacteria bacterium]
MNFFAYKTTGLAVKILTAFSKARITLHNEKDLPKGGSIFVINHFTRLETLLLPYHISKLLNKPVWSLASSEFFGGLMGRYLEQVGAVSIGDPERDKLIIKSLVGENAAWIVFPEGRMVKNRKVVDRGNFMVTAERGKYPPRTGAAALAWRAEILRRRLLAFKDSQTAGFAALATVFDLPPEASVTESINIVPVNVSYYPLRFTDTILSRFSTMLEDKLSSRMLEEVMVESSMLLSGVDIDIRFGEALPVADSVKKFFGAKTPDFVNDKKSKRVLKKLTDDAMAAIYGLTTVNLDHLLAALLYKTSGRSFAEIDFRRRSFLAVTSKGRALGIYHHQDLKNSQVDLLLGKDGGRITDLLELAEEKGFLQVSGEVDEKIGSSKSRLRFLEPGKDSGTDAFHRVRLENPFLVMANAIEPLPALQQLLRRLSWTPAWYLRRLVGKRLLKLMEQTYLDDRKPFQEDSELCPLAVGNYYLVTRRAQVGIVLIHDWLTTPQSLKRLADYLGRQGFLVLVPRLPGHATVAADLEKRGYEQWQTAVDEAYAYVRCFCPKVVVCGVGSSVALALSLAARGHEMLALLALFPTFGSSRQLLSEAPLEDKEDEITPDHTDLPQSNCAYQSFPASSRRQLKKMLVQAAKNLPLVETPLMMLQAYAADKADRQNTHKYFDKLASPEKELLLLSSAELDSLITGTSHGGRALVDFILRYCR